MFSDAATDVLPAAGDLSNQVSEPTESTGPVDGGPGGARARVLDRSLVGARARVLDRYERLLAAARDLANERHSATFTVQEVAARAECSLKGFYGCFAGKDDLLVALLAEDSAIGAALLDDAVRAERAHADRLRVCVTGLFDLTALPGATGYARVLVSEYRRLAEERADDLRAALAPIVEVIARSIRDAARAGEADSTDPGRDADTVFRLVLDGIDDVTLGRVAAPDRARHLWGFCGRALGVLPAPTSSGPALDRPPASDAPAVPTAPTTPSIAPAAPSSTGPGPVDAPATDPEESS